MRMLSFYINRAGRNLDARQLAELRKAKDLLHHRVQQQRVSVKGSAHRKNAA
jgi:hypothetical protein